jgi:hypothetical protein
MDLDLTERWISGDENFGKAKDGSSVSLVAIMAAVVPGCGNRRIHHPWPGLDYGQANLDSFRHVVHHPPLSSPWIAGYGLLNFRRRAYVLFYIQVDETLSNPSSKRLRELHPAMCLYLQTETLACSRDMASTLLDCGEALLE